VIRTARNLILLHLGANALLLWLAYQWLSVDESSTAKLIWSGVYALVILSLACWLAGGTIVYFRLPGAPRIRDAFRAVLPHVATLVLLTLLTLALYGLVAQWAAACGQPPFRAASWLTMKLRKPVKPATIASVYHAGFWLVRWVILPVLLLPLFAGIASKGWRGWREVLVRKSWRNCVAIPVLLLAGLWLPRVLLNWSPHSGAFAVEMASFVLRAAVAYLLFVASMILLAARTR
jgi:hypothetical protein